MTAPPPRAFNATLAFVWKDGRQEFVPVAVEERWWTPNATVFDIERELPNVARRALEKLPQRIGARLSGKADDEPAEPAEFPAAGRAQSLKGL